MPAAAAVQQQQQLLTGDSICQTRLGLCVVGGGRVVAVVWGDGVDSRV